MTDSRSSLAGRTALVTGAGRRIGRAIAQALSRAGVNLVLHYRSSEAEAESLRREAEAAGVRAWTVRADFADPEETGRLIDQAWDLTGALDLLVNNASIFPAGGLDELDFDTLAAVETINAWAPFLLCRAFARRTKQGSVVNLLDTRIEGFDFRHAAYILSKHLLAQLTRMSAVAYAPGIRVNAVSPGLILPPTGGDETPLDTLARELPLRRHGEPEDVADAVLMLLGNPFITGAVLPVDGGRHLHANES